MEFAEPVFGKAPETFDSVDVVGSEGKLVVAMIDSAMFVVADFDQPVLASPAIGMEHGL